MKVLPGNIEQFENILSSIIELTKQETGCINYSASKELSNRDRFNVLEE